MFKKHNRAELNIVRPSPGKVEREGMNKTITTTRLSVENVNETRCNYNKCAHVDANECKHEKSDGRSFTHFDVNLVLLK